MTTIWQLTEKDTDSDITVTDELYAQLEDAIAQGEAIIREAVEEPKLEVSWQLEDGVYTWTHDAMQVAVWARRVH